MKGGIGNQAVGAKITRFEDLMAWQEARTLAREIYGLSGNGLFRQDFGLRDQIRRASVSVMSNLAEGFERMGIGEKMQFMNIARASCAEVKSLLYVCLDNSYLEACVVPDLHARCSRISRLTSGLIRSISTERNREMEPSESKANPARTTPTDSGY